MDIAAPELELKPIPNSEWANQWADLMRDAWLKRKLDRKRRVREQWDYLQKFAPEYVANPGALFDLGPGAGELLEIALALGGFAFGLEAPDGEGGMGNTYLEACRLLHQRQGIDTRILPMRLRDLLDLLEKGDNFSQIVSGHKFSLINSRGSFEQMFAHCMEGPPHHEHHKSDRLAWRLDGGTQDELYRFFFLSFQLLAPGGLLLIHFNGSKNHDLLEDGIRAITTEIEGLKETPMNHPRVMRWMRRS